MRGRPAPNWAALALLFLLLAAPGPCVGAEKAEAKKKPWYWSQFKPEAAAATTIDKSEDFSVARNLWFHVQRFFAVLDSKDINKYDPNNHTIGADIPFSQNILVCKLPFTDVPRHYRNIQAGMLRGTTLWIDFPFPAFPENMGHWAEVLAPVYSALTEGAWKERAPEADGYINALLFPNLRRSQVQGLIWVMDMLRLTLRPGLASPRALPRMLFADELEALDPTAWLALERVLLVHTRYHLPSGRNGFVKPEHAAAFREAAYAAANISLGGPAWQAGVAPPVITYLMAMNHEPVVNSGEVLGALRQVGDELGMAVRPYSVTPGAAFPSFVASMAQTGVLVARHGPLLANAMFLPPGAVVLELLPYNWEWQGISEIYLNLTRSVGCVHHFAWKANSSEWVVYLEPEDAKYSHWTPEECSSSYCLEAHARAGMLVDTQRLKEMLMAVLPDALKGAPVAELAPRLPWPAATKNRTSVLWFHRRSLSSLVARAEKQTDTERRPSLPEQPVAVTSSQEDPEEFETAYGLFNWKAYNEGFDVPWGAKETVLGMVAWSAAFVGVGLAFIPVLREVAGPGGFSGLSATDKSVFALVNQVVETAVSLAIIRLGVAKFEPLPPELFKYDLGQPFKKPRGWLTWGLLGVALSPAVVYVSAVLSEGLGASDAAGRGTVDAVSSIITMDFSTYASLFATTAILAPLLEETVFRGFLLTSLTKWMPVPAAVALSSLAFGMVHLTPRDFPQLTALGFLLGFSYVRSRNLLTPMLIHGAWNGSVLTILFLLASQGIDIQELIHAN